MVKHLPLVLGFCLASSFGGTAAGQVVSHPHHMVSIHGEVTILVWVSGDALKASEPPEGFPTGWWSSVERARTGLTQQLLARSAHTVGCLPRPEGEPTLHDPAAQKSASPIDYSAFLASSDVVLVGEVRTVEPGVTVKGEGGIAPRVRVYAPPLKQVCSRSRGLAP